MTFNPEITFTTIISVLTMVFIAGGFYYGNKSLFEKVNDLKKEVTDFKDGLKEDLKALNKVVMDVALSNQRQDNFEKRHDSDISAIKDDIREMKHGKGFVKDA